MTDISVLMPVYNVSSYPAGWVQRAIDSVLVHQSADVELCIVDDCSTDDTAEFIASLTDPRIKVGKTKQNSGGVEAVNIAGEMATGRYFTLLSCRSWYEPESLAKMARYLDEHAEVGFVYGQTMFYDDPRFGDWLKTPDPFEAEAFRERFVSSFGYLYRREAWDAGMRYGCTIWLEKEKRFMTIADHHMAMNLIFKMNYQGYCMRDQLVLHYDHSGLHMHNLLVKYRAEIKKEFRRLWGNT